MGINYSLSCFSTFPGAGLVFTEIQVPGTTPGIPDLPMWDQPLPGAVGPVPVFHAHTSLTPCSSCTKSTYKYKNNDNDNIKDESKRINAWDTGNAVFLIYFHWAKKKCCLICNTNIMSYNTIQWSIVSLCFLFLHSSTQTFTPWVLRFGARFAVIYAFDHTALFVCSYFMKWWWNDDHDDYDALTRQLWG